MTRRLVPSNNGLWRKGVLARRMRIQRQRRPTLRLESSACGLPHPQKRATGGEDAWFISGDTVGVADGVGGWARKGIDSGEYARKLKNSAERVVAMADKTLTPLQVLTVAHRNAKCLGSSTACIVQLEDLSLRAINLGDSGFIFQCHYFNCPYQLGFGANGDEPEMGEVYDVETQEGDVIVLGTDGLFDNLFPKQIASLLDTVLPFTPELDLHSMKKAGYEYRGGKMDDITVVTSLVTSA
ncbi:unnamed protein product [Peronospora farinosa]|uniref:Protein phosphatase n=1 Tax=Peronospora farinosa TaxID=134698 RepID=A0AAV0TDS5_9STRA|nr:unnamed protein product [Peronospora farinosa]CAI5720249.1 unnamed protein product [Peronospora farinosa]